MDPPAPSTTGFILAGGRSLRMNRDKAMLAWGDGTLLEHMMSRLGAVTARVFVVGREELPDRVPGRGPVEGVRTALEASETEDNLIVAVDLPFLETRLLGAMLARLRTGDPDAVVCSSGGPTPVCLAVRRRLLSRVTDYLESGGASLQGLLAGTAHTVLDAQEIARWAAPPRAFHNINTPEDYRRAIELAFGHPDRGW